MSSVQALRGMHDLLPQQSASRLWLEKQLSQIAIDYGFSEIRTPLIESIDLFQRSIGESTDIIEKEMYLVSGKSGKTSALRPESTAGCVRALLEHGQLRQEQKIWYLGPMFRYERPQAGRYRQFHQFGIEHFGVPAPWPDIALLALTRRLWQRLSIEPQLEINTIGKLAERKQYNQELVRYLQQHKHNLDADSQRRLDNNPLRILDSKNQQTKELLDHAPKLIDYVSQQSRDTFIQIQSSLDSLGIPWLYNPRLVRGLDYYNDLVFEWTTNKLGSQSAICSGGRYDSLTCQLGGKKEIPAIGFALGIERLELLLQKSDLLPNIATTEVFFICTLPQQEAIEQKERLHNLLPTTSIASDLTGSSLKSQLKKADKSGAKWALIVGEDELAKDAISIKFLRQKKEQMQLKCNQLSNFFQSLDGDISV